MSIQGWIKVAMWSALNSIKCFWFSARKVYADKRWCTAFSSTEMDNCSCLSATAESLWWAWSDVNNQTSSIWQVSIYMHLISRQKTCWPRKWLTDQSMDNSKQRYTCLHTWYNELSVYTGYGFNQELLYLNQPITYSIKNEITKIEMHQYLTEQIESEIICLLGVGLIDKRTRHQLKNQSIHQPTNLLID